MSTTKVAIIGYGHLGKWHTQKANSLDGADLVAIVEPFEPNRKAAKETYPDVKVVESLDEIIDEIDTAVVVTPTSFHYETVKSLLKANKNVFCEKPLCSTVDEARDLKQYIGKQIVQVGHSERCHQAWEILRDKIQSIKGKKTIKINRFAAFKGRATDVDVVQDLMIHDIDLMFYILGAKPIKLSSTGQKIRTDKWDHVTTHFWLDNGDEVYITSGRNHVKEVRALEIMSNEGCIEVDLFKNEIHFATDSIFEDETYVKSQSYEKRDHLLIEQEKFYHSINHNADVFVTYEDGVNAVEIVTKVLESLDSEGIIEL